jgi:fido (protein-threonine AMPylation protein)
MVKEKGSFLWIHDQNDIDHYLDELFEDADKKIMLCNNRLAFCEILANLYTKLIYCHPYREGNGRAVREFIREYSIAKSEEVGIGKMELDWTKVNRDELNQYIEVSHLFPGQTAILFMNALVPTNVKIK